MVVELLLLGQSAEDLSNKYSMYTACISILKGFIYEILFFNQQR